MYLEINYLLIDLFINKLLIDLFIIKLLNRFMCKQMIYWQIYLFITNLFIDRSICI